MSPGGGSGWDEPPLDIQIPDDARELAREVLAYHRELRAKRRRNRLRRLAGPFAGHGTIMPLLASILAVCLVAGAMLSVATFSPAPSPAEHKVQPTATTSAAHPTPRSSAPVRPSASTPAATSPAATSPAATSPAATSRAATSRASRSVSPSARPRSVGQASGSASPGAPR